jgi:hypothetical protein
MKSVNIIMRFSATIKKLQELQVSSLKAYDQWTSWVCEG